MGHVLSDMDSQWIERLERQGFHMFQLGHVLSDMDRMSFAFFPIGAVGLRFQLGHVLSDMDRAAIAAQKGRLTYLFQLGHVSSDMDRMMRDIKVSMKARV